MGKSSIWQTDWHVWAIFAEWRPADFYMRQRWKYVKVSTRSKFERKLGFRQIGFSIKIPDVGRSLKPFDYVVGVPVQSRDSKILRFVAIEAKTATGWTLRGDAILPHQHKALSLVESMARYSAWVAIGFLDMPKMKLDWNRERIDGRLRPEAFLLWWQDFLYIKRPNGGVRYKDIIELYQPSKMDYVKTKSGYRWVPGAHSDFYERVSL